MKTKANFLYKPGNFQMDDCQIDKVVELTYEEFCKLKITPGMDQPFIKENKSCMFSKDGIMHCLLALGRDTNDGVLIDSEGYDYPRYAAYIPGMRDIVNAELDRAADFIVRQGTENTQSGCWAIYYEELEQHLGLTVHKGNGFDTMLRDKLNQRPEVQEVELVGEGIDTTYYSNYCKRVASLTESRAQGPRLKDILPLLKGSPTFLCHVEAEMSVLAENLRLLTGVVQEDFAALLNARVTEIGDRPDGTEVVLTDVDPRELVRFNEAYEAFMEAEQAMGPTMGGLT